MEEGVCIMMYYMWPVRGVYRTAAFEKLPYNNCAYYYDKLTLGDRKSVV